MARENQGLQIALIIFVMLTVILGVTTFLFFRRYEEADTKMKAAQKDAADKAAEALGKKEDNNWLKTIIGVPVTDERQAIETQFAQDMKTYAETFPEAQRFYRPLVKELADVINVRNDRLAKASAEIQTLKDTLAVREKGKDTQIAQLDDAAKRAGTDLLAERGKFNAERKRITDEQEQLTQRLDKARKESQEAMAKVEAKLQETGVRLQKLAALNKEKSDKIREIEKETITVPSGEIRWVDQRQGTVWINVGQADGLNRQTSFSVFPKDITNLAKAVKKASIEVTLVRGAHLAEARILEDKISDPIMPGDKIFSPIWSPGEVRRFAFVGRIDLDGDGKSDLDTVRNLVKANGGDVDCWVDDKGERHGEMTLKTRYLVRGDKPDEKSLPAVIAAWSKMLDDAERLGIEKISLQEFKERMGYKNLTPVVRYGLGANPDDFRAKPPDRGPRVSTGNVSDVFKPRTPPRGGPGGAY